MKRPLKVALIGLAALAVSTPSAGFAFADPGDPSSAPLTPVTEGSAFLPSGGPTGTQVITLSAKDQPKANRPVLDRLTREAKEQGIPLKKALDKYAQEVIAKNPAAQADMPDGPVPDPTIVVDGIPFAELVDLSRLAQAKNITYEEAIDRYAWTPAINKVGAKLAADFPNDVSGVTITNGGRSARIGFKNNVPPEAITLAKTLPVEVELISGKGFSEAELKNTLEEHQTALAARDEIASSAGQYDLETGIITFKAQPSVKSISNKERDQLRAALQPKPSENARIKINLEIIDDLGIKLTDKYLRGGGYLAQSDGITRVCTGGFNIVSGSGDHATTTAKHCAGDLYYVYLNHPDYSDQTTTVARQFRTTKYDLARYGGGGMTYTRTFYYDLNSPRYVRANGSFPSVGQPICSFGRSSSDANLTPRCGEITGSNATIEFGGVKYYGNIVTNYQLLQGDSGGPGYWGSTAWGITSAGDGPASWLAATDRINDSDGMGSNWNIWTCPTC